LTGKKKKKEGREQFNAEKALQLHARYLYLEALDEGREKKGERRGGGGRENQQNSVLNDFLVRRQAEQQKGGKKRAKKKKKKGGKGSLAYRANRRVDCDGARKREEKKKSEKEGKERQIASLTSTGADISAKRKEVLKEKKKGTSFARWAKELKKAEKGRVKLQAFLTLVFARGIPREGRGGLWKKEEKKKQSGASNTTRSRCVGRGPRPRDWGEGKGKEEGRKDCITAFPLRYIHGKGKSRGEKGRRRGRKRKTRSLSRNPIHMRWPVPDEGGGGRKAEEGGRKGGGGGGN